MIEITTYTSNKYGTWLDDIFLAKTNTNFKFKWSNNNFFYVTIYYQEGTYNTIFQTFNWIKIGNIKETSKERLRDKLKIFLETQGFKERHNYDIFSKWNISNFSEGLELNEKISDNWNMSERSNKLKSVILESIKDFNKESIVKIKENSYSFIWNQFDQVRTEREIEENSFVRKLKEWIVLEEKIDLIIEDIKSKININEIDYITYTPDSWNYNVDYKHVTVKWFSAIVTYIATKLVKPTILPELTRSMWKQKEQKSLKDRLQNRLGAYSFHKDFINWKKILFIDDVLTTWATMLSIADEIYKKGWDLEIYFIADAEKDEDEGKNNSI